MNLFSIKKERKQNKRVLNQWKNKTKQKKKQNKKALCDVGTEVLVLIQKH